MALNETSVIAQEYETALADLVINSKPIINTLTIIAGENSTAAEEIVSLIETRIQTIELDKVLPSFYLLDSICKNVGEPYTSLFSRHIVELFCSTFNRATSSMRQSMVHLLRTWNGLFSQPKLKQIETQLSKTLLTKQSLVTPSATTIHINPKFVASRTNATNEPDKRLGDVGRVDQILAGFDKVPSNDPRKNVQQAEKPKSIPTPPASNAKPVLASGDPNNPAPLAPNVQINQILQEIQQRLNQKLSHSDLIHLLDHVNKIQEQQQNQVLAQIQAQLYSLAQGATFTGTTVPVPSQEPSMPLVVPLANPYSFIPTRLPVYSSNPALVPGFVPQIPIIGGLAVGSMQPPLVMPTNPFISPQPLPSYYNMAPDSLNSPPTANPNLVASQEPSSSTKEVPASEPTDLFSNQSLQSFNEKSVNSLYFSFPLQCKTCGLRFSDRERMDKHLDWHFSQNKKQKERTKKAISRSWYLTKSDWIEDSTISEKTITPFFGSTETGETAQNENVVSTPALAKEEPTRIVADYSQTQCSICGEKFEQFWSSEHEEWMYKDVVLENGVIYHQKCRQNQLQKSNLDSPPPLEEFPSTSKRPREELNGEEFESKKLIRTE